jgi:hypothetical protein
LYALVAREWLNGHLPYTTVWETKPPLFFAILAASMLAFGKSMLALRIASDAAIACTAFALYEVGRSVHRGGHRIGLTAAMLYAALTISDSGSSAVAEIFYAPFVAIPLALILRDRIPSRAPARGLSLIGLGALLGCAVLIKESALLEVAYVAGVLLWACEAAYVAPLMLGIVLAIAASTVPYFVTGNFPLYWDANVGAVARRAFVAVPDVAPWTDVVRAQCLAFFPATLLIFGTAWAWKREESDADDRILIAAMSGWAVVSLLTVVAIREYLGNHFIGAMAPACVLSALVTVRLAARLRRPAFVPAVIALALVSHAAYQFVLAAPVAYGRIRTGDPAFGDPTAQLGVYLASQAAAGRAPHVATDPGLHVGGDRPLLYVADDRTVLYVLTGAAPPTRYPYPAHLLDRYQELVAGVDGPREIARIVQLHPTFIVRDLANRRYEDPPGRDLLDQALQSGYRSVYALGTRTVYRFSGPGLP